MIKWICLAFLLLGVVLSLAGGCREQSRYRDVQTELDKALYYYEVDRLDARHPISSPFADAPPHCTTGVPAPAIVDIDSHVEILVDADRLKPPGDSDVLKTRLDALLERKEKIRKALTQLSKYVDTRIAAVEAYRGGDRQAFRQAKKEFGVAASDLLTELSELWGLDTPEGETLDRIFLERKSDPTMRQLHDFLQAQIDAIEAEDRTLAEQVRQAVRTLRLEAQVLGDGRDPVYVHLEGYDTLEQGQRQPRDRFGINLPPDERARLEEQMKATQELAATAEALRRKEISVQEAIARMAPYVSDELTASLSDIQRLADKYSGSAMEERLQAIKDALEALMPEVTETAGGLSEEMKARLNETPARFYLWLKENRFDTMVLVFGVAEEVQAIWARWKHPTLADQATLVLDSAGVLVKVERLIEDEKLETDIGQAMKQFLQDETDAISKQVIEAFAQVLQGESAAVLRSHLEEIHADFMLMARRIREMQDRLSVFGAATEVVEVPSPHAVDVPVDDIRDTYMDFTRVRLAPGNEVLVRASLRDEGNEVDVSTALFRVERLGWYAELSPSVVLVRPLDLAGGSDDFRFAPALSWLHHYVPRPAEQGWVMDLLRTLDPAVGPHSIFTHFEGVGDTEAVQIGLGGTLAFWKDRLQFGLGYNLMADSDDDGRYYFFVGTDLIGLLQTLGLDKGR